MNEMRKRYVSELRSLISPPFQKTVTRIIRGEGGAVPLHPSDMLQPFSNTGTNGFVGVCGGGGSQLIHLAEKLKAAWILSNLEDDLAT